MEDLNETRRDQVKETLARSEEDRDMWGRLLEDSKRKQGQEIGRSIRSDRKIGNSENGTTVTCRKCSPWAIADGSSDASQSDSKKGSASPNSTR